MARQHRIEYAGALYHVMARGDRKDPIVMDDGDRKAFIKALNDMCERTGIVAHAYTLMDNHYHLVLETPKANLVDGMRWFQNTYTRRFNVCHQLWGHVFGGRYKAVIIDPEDDYFVKAVNYVHLNPVRAGIVGMDQGIQHYPWSSLYDYLQPPNRRPVWLKTDRLFAMYGLKDNLSGRKAYLKELERMIRDKGEENAGLVDDDVDTSLQTTIRRGWYFGSEDFHEHLLGLLDRHKKKGAQPACDGYHGTQSKEMETARAKAMINRMCRGLNIALDELKKRKARDDDKIMMAEIIASQTSVRVDWIRETLGMGSRGYCSHLISLQRRLLKDHPKRAKARSRMLKISRSND